MIADRHILINRTRRVPFDVTTRVTDAPAPKVKPDATPLATEQAVFVVTPVPPTRYRHATIAALFFGAAWLLFVPWLVDLGVVGTGVSLGLAVILLVAAHEAKGVKAI